MHSANQNQIQLVLQQQNILADQLNTVTELLQRSAATRTQNASVVVGTTSSSAFAGGPSTSASSGFETASDLITRLLRQNSSAALRRQGQQLQQPAASSGATPQTSSAPSTTTPFSFNFATQCRERATRVIEKMWARDTTWKNRGHLWQRFQTWVDHHPAQSADWAVATFCESTMTAPQARLQYAKDLVAMLARMGTQTPVARMYMAGLRSSGALIPEHQAYPISVEQIQSAIKTAQQQRHIGLAAALFIAWKTASRWSDVNRLVRRNIVNPTAQRLTVYWGDATKTTRAEPFAVRGFTVMEHPAGMQWLIDYLNTLEPDQFVCTWCTDKATKWMHETLPVADPLRRVSASSIKRGAVTFLVRAAARGQLSPELISRVAKHKHWFEEISATTIRYVGEEVWEELALCLRTQEATRLLP